MPYSGNTNYLVSNARSISCSFIKQIILANDYLLQTARTSQKQQARDLKQQGLRIVENTYYALKRGTYTQISTFFLSALCAYWKSSIPDMFAIGITIERGETPDLSRYGLNEETERRRIITQVQKRIIRAKNQP